jgi:hypothetical protein
VKPRSQIIIDIDLHLRVHYWELRYSQEKQHIGVKLGGNLWMPLQYILQDEIASAIIDCMESV